MKKSYFAKSLLALSLIAVMCFSIASFAGCNAGLYINAPEKLEAELGVYVIPDYDVVNANGMIMAGYDVRLKSVTDANGKKVDFDQNSVTVQEKGVYKFVYGAKGVKDAAVSIDFADRTAPTVNFAASNLPSFFITGNSYRIPAYTLSGDYVRDKCFVKVFHIADDTNKTETEVEIKANRFDVSETGGAYEIRIHVEDAAGNVRDYAYQRPVDGPEQLKENTIIYFDEAFGERQVYCVESSYTGKYVSNDVLGDKAREGDNGAYQVKFNGTETKNNEGYITLKTPAILDVNGFTELEMYVYNDSDQDAIFGATWWNDTKIKKGEWTRISFSVDNWGNCVWAENSTKVVSTNDISNMGLRFIFAYDQQTVPTGTFYLSPLKGVPRIHSEVTAGDDVTLDKASYSVGGKVALTAAEKEGKVVDCFLVDGKPIVGDTFTVTEAQHHVTVKYVDELTVDNMTWATGFHYTAANSKWMTSNFMGVDFIGSSDKWVISTDVIGGYNENTGGQTMNLTWMIGDIESVELQMSRDGGQFKWYFAGGSAWNTPIATVSSANFQKLKNASEENPVNITVMRNGDMLLFTIDNEFAAVCKIENSLSSNAFGIGYRKEGADKPDTVLLADTKAVMGEERTEFYYATLTAQITKENDDVSTDKEAYRLGETVVLTAQEKTDGHVFGYFTVDGDKIVGNRFTVTSKTHTVGVVYVNLSTITFQGGVTAAEGNSVGVGSNLTLSHGEAPEQGKVFDHYLVDGTIKVYGNVFTVTGNEHTISAVWVDASDITWGDADDRHTCGNIMGSEAAVWQGRNLDGYVFGSSEYWAVKLDVKHTTEWNSFEFIQGSKQSIRIRFHQGNYFGIIVITDSGSEDAPNGYDEFVHAFPHQNAEMVAKLLAGTTITCIRYGDTITMYADNVPFFTTDYAVDHTGNWFGVGYVNAESAGKPEMKNIEFIMGKDKVDAYLDNNWQDVTVNTDENVTLDKQSYKQYEVVKLTAKEAPEGKMFAYFTVNGIKLEGDSFTAKELTYEVKAVYNDVSAIELAQGITTADGKTVYVVGAVVQLTFDGEVPQGKFFDCFKVDGVKINGNSFVTSNATHSVEAVFASNAENMTWTSADWKAPEGGDAQKTVLGSGKQWVLSYNVYGFEFGDNFLASSSQYIGAYVGNVSNGADQLVGFEFAAWGNKFDAYGGNWTSATRSITEASLMSLFKNSTQENPLTIVYVRTGELLKAYLISESTTYYLSTVNLTTLGVTSDGFGIGARNGNKVPNVTNINYVEGVDKTDAYIKTITVTINKTNVTTDAEEYDFGDTVTLTASVAPAGQKFSHFELDGVKLEGNSFVAVKSVYTITAVYSDISTVELGAGVATSDGQTEYARGTAVTISYDKSALNGKPFDYFTVDGQRIVGDTFVTSAAQHVVAIVTADSVDELTWVSSTEAQTENVSYNWSAYKFNGVSVGKSDYWVMDVSVGNLVDFEEGKDKWYGFDVLVGTNASIHIRLHTTAGLSITAMGTEHLDGKNIGTVLNGNKVIAACKTATDENPVTFTVIRNGSAYYVLFNGELVVSSNYDFKAADNKFGVGKTDCGWLPLYDVTKYEYRTGEEIAVHKLSVNVTATNVTLDKADGIYALGDTVTLTAAVAPAGQKFSHFELDGVKLDDNKFTAIKSAYEVVAVYSDISSLTLGEGVLTVDGETEYARNVKVKLSFDSEKLNGKVVDYYLVDKDTANEIRVYNGEFTATAATHTVEAVLVEPSEITWANGGADYDYETVMGENASEWKTREFTGEVYGSAEYWAVSVDVKFASDWKSFEFIQGSKQSIRVRFHSSGYCGVLLMTGKTTETKPSAEFIDAYPNKNEQVVNKLLAGATVTCVRNGATVAMYVDGYLFFTTNYAVDHTGNWFGVGHVDGNDATAPEMSNTKFITGKDKVEAYLAALAESDKTQQSETQINLVKGATMKDGSVAGYVTDGIPAGLNDANVKEAGVLKITAASGDVAFNPGWTFDTNPSAYESLYYYVYIESNDALNNVGAGAYWQDKTEIIANTWVKVELDSTMIAELSGGANTDLSKITIRIYSKTWISGYTDITEKTIYVTSLYGVPKS